MIVNSENLRAAFVGFKQLFNEAFDAAPSDWTQVATEVPSTTAREIYPWLGRNTKFREWVGNRVYQNLETHDFAITNKHYENTVEIKVDEFEDDQYGIYAPIFRQLGQNAKTHPDKLIFPVLQSGTSAKCYDGQPFFAMAHPGWDANGNAITVANMDANGTGPWWYLMDTSKEVRPLIFQKRKNYTFVSRFRPDDPHVFEMNAFLYGVDARVAAGFGLWQFAFASNQPLDSTHYGNAMAALRSLRTEAGDSMDVRPNLLVVGPSNQGPGNTVLKAETINASTNIWRDTAKLLVSNWLS